MTAQSAHHQQQAAMRSDGKDRPSLSGHGASHNTAPDLSDALPTPFGNASTANTGGAHFTNTVPQGPYPDIGFPGPLNEFDMMSNWQWSLPPFWNWQDFASGAPLGPVVPGVDLAEDNMPDTQLT